MHKANYEQQKVITVFAPNGTQRGLFTTILATGLIGVAPAGTMPDVITMAQAESEGDAIEGAIPNGGIVLVQAGTAITRGTEVTGDANGRAVAAASGNAIAGKALTSADAAREFIAVQFNYRGTAA